MKLIIEIDDKDYELAKADKVSCGYQCRHIMVAVKNGTPYNPSGDCISREALKEAVKKRFDNSEYFPFHFLALIDNAQPVDAVVNTIEVRTKGEWINREAISNTIFPFWERYECNQCHKFNGYSNFCPNCGADMRGGTE